MAVSCCQVYACIDDEACPGGSADAVSRCAAYRAADEVACGLCEDGAFLTRDDNCEDCGRDLSAPDQASYHSNFLDLLVVK